MQLLRWNALLEEVLKWLGCVPAAAGAVEGDAEDEELEVVVANLREQRDKVLALHMCKDFSFAADLLMARRILSCHTTCNCT